MLNEKQKQAVYSNSNHILVVAGAGSGKTTILIEKIKRHLKEGIEPRNILAITFTKKASLEMRKRLKNEDVNIYTFDALCYDHLNKSSKILIIQESNMPFSKNEQMSFQIYQIKKNIKKPEKYDKYIKYKKDNKLSDFYDLEQRFLTWLNYNKLNYEYILIDEFQDTNILQYQIFKKMVNKETKTFIVGDPDQSIYNFRGAKMEILFRYEKDFDAELIILDTNYRSTKEIIDVANNLISHNKKRYEKNLVPIKNLMTTPYYCVLNSNKEEYKFIEYSINSYITKYKNKNIAIIYRNHERSFYIKKIKTQYPFISFLSFHEAKGLEFDFCIILGLTKKEMIINNIHDKTILEEERRMMFVAVTRARKHLLITSVINKPFFIKELGLKSLK